MIADFFNRMKAKKRVKEKSKAVDERKKKHLSKLGEMREGLLTIQVNLDKLKGSADAARRTNLPHTP